MKEKQLELLSYMYSKYIKDSNYHKRMIKSIKEEECSVLWYEKILDLVQDNFDGMISTNEIIELLNLDSSDEVLDIGSGFGGVSLAVAKKMKEIRNTEKMPKSIGHVTGVEIQKDRCDFAMSISEKLGVDELVSFECDYFPDTKLLKEKYTKIVSVLAILHFIDKEKTLKKIGSLLAPGGTLVIEDYYTIEDNLSQKDKDALLSTISIPNLMTKEKYIDILRESGVMIKDENVIDLTEKWGGLCNNRVIDNENKKDELINAWGEEKATNHVEFCKGVHELYAKGVIHGFRIIGTKKTKGSKK